MLLSLKLLLYKMIDIIALFTSIERQSIEPCPWIQIISCSLSLSLSLFIVVLFVFFVVVDVVVFVVYFMFLFRVVVLARIPKDAPCTVTRTQKFHDKVHRRARKKNENFTWCHVGRNVAPKFRTLRRPIAFAIAASSAVAAERLCCLCCWWSCDCWSLLVRRCACHFCKADFVCWLI